MTPDFTHPMRAETLSLLAKVDYSVGANPNSASIGDLNYDGNPDLVVVNGDSNSVSVLMGKVNGTFLPKVDYSIVNGSGPTIADINHDAKLDIVVALETDAVGIRLNKGNKVVSSQVNYVTGLGPNKPTIGDVNLDGKLDIITANQDSNSISVLLGKGNGTFSPKVDYRTGLNPQRLAIGDLNYDGKPDLVAVNANSNTVSVLINNSH